MSAGTTRPLSLLHVDFDALFARHLYRHSQVGINVGHLLALYGLWFGVYAAIAQGVRIVGLPAWPFVVSMAAAYLVAISLNAPFRVIVATACFLAIFVASVLALPNLPAWSVPAFLALAPICYKIQSWNHRIWTAAADMTEVNKQFPPGRDLNVILLVYEVPVCLNYLVFRRDVWRR